MHVVCKRCVTAWGVVYAWGSNHYGQLGIGGPTTTTSTCMKVDALNGTHISSVACGDFHTLFLTSDGKRMWSCGDGHYGRLGIGNTNTMFTPALVSTSHLTSAITTIEVVCAGGASSAAITSNGCIYTWGDNRHGQLG